MTAFDVSIIIKITDNPLPRQTQIDSGIARWQCCRGHPEIAAATIPALAFRPAVHVHYQEAVLRIKDGLPRQHDVPKKMGGSGIVLPE